MTLTRMTQVGGKCWSHEDVGRMKSVLVADFSDLMNRNSDEGLHWTSTKIDLIELAHIVWETGELVDEYGRPLSFSDISARICCVLNLTPTPNPWTFYDRVLTRKNIKVRSVLERYLLLYKKGGILDPMRLDIKRQNV